VIRFLAAIFTVFLLSTANTHAKIAKPETLNETLILMAKAFQAGKQQIKNITIDLEDNSLTISLQNEKEVIIYPDNLHAKLLSTSSDANRQTVFDEHIAFLFEALREHEEPGNTSDHTQIYPVLRHKEYRATLETQHSDTEMITTGRIGDMDILFVLDSPQSVAFVMRQDLDQLQLSIKELEVRALTNLTRKKDDLRIEGSGPYSLVLDGFYETSMLLEDRLWNEITSKFGEILLAMPARDLVVFLPASTPDAEQFLRDFIQENHNAPYPMSEYVFRRSGSDWIALDP
jgi:uncharacterized protein YtpQ (UPF0354 family)